MSDGNLVYERLEFASLDETLVEIASGDPERAARALLGAALESPDRAWVEACAISFCLTEDLALCRAGLLTLGHVARRFGAVNVAAVERVLARLAGSDLSGADDDLRDDLRHWGFL